MTKFKVYPKVIIVGRTNVGKSTLFNRLIKDNQNIVLNEEGVTRDYISNAVTWDNKTFDLIDTGGVSLKKQTDTLLEIVRQKVFKLFDQAELILFICDVKNGMTQQDRQIAKTLHKTKKPVLLVLNKADNTSALQENRHEFSALGFKEIFEISATHGTGVRELLEKIIQIIREPQTTSKQEQPVYNVAILGKPNVGKSSLMNHLVKEERSIVHERTGTTREAISENIFFSQDLIQITDTAGVRKKARITKDLENLMVKSSLAAVRKSDIVLLVIDASEQKLGDQELKLLFYIFEQKKCLILVMNKTDLLTEYDRKSFEHNLKKYEFIIKKIPVVWISCKTQKSVHKVYREISKVWARRNQTFDNTQVDELIKTDLQKKPMYHKRQLLKVFKIKRTTAKTLIFFLVVNYPEWFGETQLGFIENILRKNYDLKGCPIKFNLKRV